jgi:uncharacterized protein YggU (UPF0235/DUF167 family)
MSSRPGSAGAFVATADGLNVAVRLTPRAGREALEGVTRLDDGTEALKAAVRAAPEDGAANAALIRLVAKSAGIAPSRVRLERGATSRRKTLLIEGGDLAMAERLSKAK